MPPEGGPLKLVRVCQSAGPSRLFNVWVSVAEVLELLVVSPLKVAVI
jgi:hypothetical protein